MSVMALDGMWLPLVYWALICSQSVWGHTGTVGGGCGGTLTAHKGTIMTPGFPARFTVPIRCLWVIAAPSSQASNQNVSIIVYLTQLYAFTGLKFTEYWIYDDDYKGGEQVVHQVTEENVTLVKWIQVRSPYLEVEFTMDHLEGQHLRALDNLLEVFGFNITYEVSNHPNSLRPFQCNVLECRFLGHCFASSDYSEYGCACFKGFSGPDCGQGPLCADPNKNGCENGATCRHMGAAAVTCQCSPGFGGDKCDVPLLDEANYECDEYSGTSMGCLLQCPFDGRPENVCRCQHGGGAKAPADRSRFEAIVRLANKTALKDGNVAAADALENLLEKHMARIKTSIEDLRVLNITSNAEVTFHFFGPKKDGVRLRDAVSKLVERGRLGNLSLVPTQLSFKQEPALLLQEVEVNRNRLVWEGKEFILSCVAQGSPYMSFRWYKDGVFVNVTKATRNIWTRLLPLDSRDRYTALLAIGQASRLDEGRYTCQVEDWGVQQCASLFVEILTAPEVKVEPMSATLFKGENITIKCLSPNSDRRHGQLGYSWTKNGALFPVSPHVEIWEDLYPDGSVLKIYNATRSAEYTCLVTNKVSPRSLSVYVGVVEPTSVPLCLEQRLLGIRWEQTAAGLQAISECPTKFIGHARRICEMKDLNSPAWSLPDFSGCVADEVVVINNLFRSLSFGYQNTTGPAILKACLTHLRSRLSLYPGEGERLLSLLQEVTSYLNQTSAKEDLLNSTVLLYDVINEILRYEHSIISQQRVLQLQSLLRTQAFVWGSLVGPHIPPLHLQLSELQVFAEHVDRLPFGLHLPLQTDREFWKYDSIDVQMNSSTEIGEQFNDSTLTVVCYKNLARYLPLLYSSLVKDGSDLEYQIISQITSIAIGRDGHSLPALPLPVSTPYLPPTSSSPSPFSSTERPPSRWLRIDVVFSHTPIALNLSRWDLACGVVDLASFGPTWDLESCFLYILSNNSSRCSCSMFGTYALLVTKRVETMNMSASMGIPMVAVVGCCCCLLQVTVAAAILVVYWAQRHSCLVYLKIQAAVTAAGAASVLVYALIGTVAKEAFPYTTTILACFFLLGMSSHLSMLLIVYTELVTFPTLPRLHHSVVGVVSGVPVVATLCTPLIHAAIDAWPTSWWLITGSLGFNVFVATAMLIVILFGYLYVTVMNKLQLLTKKHAGKNKSISKRIGLIRRAAIILAATFVLEISSLCHINIADDASQYVLGASCAILGLIIVTCYVIKPESAIRFRSITSFKKQIIDKDYSSESANSPLNFFTKQEGEIESEGAPPITDNSRNGSRAKHPEDFLLSNSRSPKFIRSSSRTAPSTIETYVGGSCEADTYEGFKLMGDSRADASLERCPESPRKYTNMTGVPQVSINTSKTYCEYVEPDARDAALNGSHQDQLPYVETFYQNTGPVFGSVRPEPGRCFLRETSHVDVEHHPLEYMTTRLCLELGMMPGLSGDRSSTEATISVEAPSIVLCSVDVEPCVLGSCGLTTVSIKETNGMCNGKDNSESGSDVTEPNIACGVQGLDIIKGIDLVECSQQDGMEKISPPVITVTGEEDANMLDRISHDLDYLLNRKTIVLNQNSLRKTSKPPSSSIRGKITEEEDESIQVANDPPQVARAAY